jgi:hypothetical protein
MLGVSNVPAHINKASPVPLISTNKLTIHGKDPLGAGADPIDVSSDHTIRPRLDRGTSGSLNIGKWGM